MDTPAKPPKKPSAGWVHTGHRSRMRRRFLAGGLERFQDHEVLELLLFYALPRRDVNEIAHLLINRFGTLAGVLDAPEEELCVIPGVGPHVAHFLNLIPEVMVQMARQSHREDAPGLIRSRDVAELLTRWRPGLALGQVLLVLTDAARRPMALHLYDGFEDLTVREVALRSANARASLVILVECVPDAEGFPLPGRLQALTALSRALDQLGTPLCDYYTSDPKGGLPLSYRRSGQLLAL